MLRARDCKYSRDESHWEYEEDDEQHDRPSLRASEPPKYRKAGAVVSFDDPATWSRFVRRRVADEVAVRFRDEIESDVMLVVARYFMQQRRIVALPRFVKSLIATFLARSLRREELLEVVAPMHLDYLPQPESKMLWADVQVPALPSLRGPVQNLLRAEILAGKTCAQIADEVDKPLKEVSRLVRDLADLIAARRRAKDLGRD